MSQKVKCSHCKKVYRVVEEGSRPLVCPSCKGLSTLALVKPKGCGCPGDTDGTYLCPYCPPGTRHLNSEICWHKATTKGVSNRIYPESFPHVAGKRSGGDGS